MASLRFYKYSEEDVSKGKKDKFMENLTKYVGTLEERDWAIEETSIKYAPTINCIEFTIIQRVEQEVVTIEGTKEFIFIEAVPLILFLEEGILAIVTTSKNLAQELKEYCNKIFFNGAFKYMPKYLESSEELLNKIEDDDSIEVVGFGSKNAMGIDKISGLDRHDIKNKEIYEQACLGTFTDKVGAKIFDDPIGKVKFCIKLNGLITLFRRNLLPQEISLISKYLLKFLQNPTSFTKTLSGFT